MKFICFLFIGLFTINTFSQDNTAEIVMKKKSVEQNGKELTPQELKTLLLSNPTSIPDYEKYKEKGAVGAILVVGGLGMVTISSFKTLNSSKQQTEDLNNGILKTQGSYDDGLGLAVVGLVCVIAGIPPSIKAKKYLGKSIDHYNNSLQNTGKIQKQYNLVISQNRIGIRMTF